MKKQILIFLILLIQLSFVSCSFFSNGQQTEYYDNGKIKAIGTIESGEKIGIWAFYDEYEIQVDSISYKNGVKDGVFTMYNLKGKIRSFKGFYQNGKEHGVWESYHDDGEVHLRQEFDQGTPIGQQIYYFSKNQPKIITEFKNGKKHGDYIEYHPNGEVSVSGKYHNGREDGEWKEYYENGLIKEVYHFQAGLWHGQYDLFYPNGKIAEKRRYELDNPTGTWEYFDINGLVISTRKYK